MSVFQVWLIYMFSYLSPPRQSMSERVWKQIHSWIRKKLYPNLFWLADCIQINLFCHLFSGCVQLKISPANTKSIANSNGTLFHLRSLENCCVKSLFQYVVFQVYAFFYTERKILQVNLGLMLLSNNNTTRFSVCIAM